MAQRFDVGSLGKAEKTPQGGIRVAAHLTRTGVFKYDGGDGKVISEYRPPEEVFAAASLSTLPDAPVTVGHVAMVTPDNHNEVAAGHVREPKQDGERVAATVVIQGRRAIKAVERGTRQISCGYTCRVDETSGQLPDGTRYDRIQRDIRYNHVALVEKGRAGDDIRLRLDAAGNQTTDEVKMEFERIDGVKYEAGTEAHAAAVKAFDKKQADAQKRLDELTASNTKNAADLEVAKADKQKLADEVATLKDPARLDAAASARASLLESAKKILGDDVKLDGLPDIEIKRLVAVKAYPTVKLDAAKDQVRIDSFYEAATLNASATADKVREDAAAVGAIRKAVVETAREDEKPNPDKAHAAMVERNRNAWKTPANGAAGK